MSDSYEQPQDDWEPGQGDPLDEDLERRIEEEREQERGESCDYCSSPDSDANPVWHYPGGEADVENGPRAADIPADVCEQCMGAEER